MVSGPKEPGGLIGFSELRGGRVRDRAGRSAGRVDDLVVSHEQAFPRVTGVVLRGAGEDEAVVPLVEMEGGMVVDTGRGRALTPDDVLVGRDLLDAQVVDVEDKRLARVGEVELAGGGPEVRVVSVDAGLAPVARRLGLHRLAARLPSDQIAWDELHVASGRGHRLQLESPAAAVHRLEPEELAELVARLPATRAAEVLGAVAPQKAAEARRAPVKRPRRRFRDVLRARKRAPS